MRMVVVSESVVSLESEGMHMHECSSVPRAERRVRVEQAGKAIVDMGTREQEQQWWCGRVTVSG